MQTEQKQEEQEYSSEMENAFYVEELETRLEMAAPGGGAAMPNLACWITQL
jgi:hypothetical protein